MFGIPSVVLVHLIVECCLHSSLQLAMGTLLTGSVVKVAVIGQKVIAEVLPECITQINQYYNEYSTCQLKYFYFMFGLIIIFLTQTNLFHLFLRECSKIK